MPSFNQTKSICSTQPARQEYGKDEDTGVYFKPVSSSIVDLEDLMNNKQLQNGLNERSIRNQFKDMLNGHYST